MIRRRSHDERPTYDLEEHSSVERWREACEQSQEWSQQMRVTSVRREALFAWVIVAAVDVLLIGALVWWFAIR